MLLIRQLAGTAEFLACQDLQRKAWKMSDEDVLPFHLIRAFCDESQPYGIVLGALEGSELHGFCFCFPTLVPGTLLMHMIAVKPGLQRQGIGAALMASMVTKSLERGFQKIVWTYDPLESVNASLYFHKMHAYCEFRPG